MLKPFFAEIWVLSVALVFSGSFPSREALESFGSYPCHPVRIPSSARGHASGPFRRPAAGSLFCLPACAARRLRFHTFGGPSANAELRPGGGASRLASPSVTRAGYGKFNETEITTMYQNKAILMGFLGSDAEVRTGKNNQKFTTFSVATKTLLQKQRNRRIPLAHRMASLHRLRQVRRVRGHAQEGRHIQVEGEISPH